MFQQQGILMFIHMCCLYTFFVRMIIIVNNYFCTHIKLLCVVIDVNECCYYFNNYVNKHHVVMSQHM